VHYAVRPLTRAATAMCRFLAYAAPVPTPVASLVPATLAEFVALARENPDGWGQAAWHGDEIRVERSLVSAGDDPAFLDVANRALGDMGIVHLRSATPPLPVNLDNNHPFVRDGLMMAHNGAIFPQETMDDMLLPGTRHVPRGTTDSERYFLAIAEEIDRGADPVTAIRRTVGRILERFQPSFLNAFLTTSDRLYAVQWHMPEPYREEYYRLFTPEVLEVYFDIRYARLDGGLVLASTGWTQPGWRTVTRAHVLEVARGTLELTEHDLFSSASRRIDAEDTVPSWPPEARSA
jgi:predicted glutamine amidotransferase